MNIAELFQNAPNLEVKEIMTDSRRKSDQAIFFCIRGMVNDGHDFIDQAVENGAICIVHSRDLDSYLPNVTYLKVADTMAALNEFCAAFYDHVTSKMKVYGVTGTNGKSTTAWVLRYLVGNFVKCGYIGTIGMIVDEKLESCPLTTPDSVFLHKVCKEMYDAGCRAVSMEVSSIGLEEHRVDSVDFDVVSFTNLTHDHLDYHGTFENYYQAKKKLFDLMSVDGKGVINIDDKYGQRLVSEIHCQPVTYAIYQDADYRAINIRLYNDHSEFDLLHEGVRYPVYTNLVAEFNIYNLLGVIAMLAEDEYPLEKIIPLLRNIPQVLGRMELINEGQPFNVMVDYAHTPDGFEKVFKYAKAITPNGKRIISVFGCAGARDTRKRPVLGRIADENCEIVVLTSEDPRMDDPEEISREIKAGITEHVSLFVEDRYNAIRQAIELANSGDTVIILGKGDEDYLDIKGKKEHWMGDQKAAQEILRNLFSQEDEYDREY